MDQYIENFVYWLKYDRPEQCPHCCRERKKHSVNECPERRLLNRIIIINCHERVLESSQTQEGKNKNIFYY